MKHGYLISAASLAVMAASAAQAATDAASVLAANRAAVGAPPAAGTLKLSYRDENSGLVGTRSRQSDLASGAFVESYALGPVTGGSGYDGTTPWMRDMSGANTAQEGGDRIPLAVNQAYRDANLWWRPDHGGATISYAGRESAGGRALDHLVVTPKGGKRFDAWFDASTHLLDHLGEEQLFFKASIAFADYRPEGGLMLAHKVTTDLGIGEGGIDRLSLQRAEVTAAEPPSRYSRPTQPPSGASIDGGAASVTVPFRLLNNHIYIEGKVGGQGPYTFIVDTGGHNLLSPRAAKAAGLTAKGAGSSSGTGEKTETISFAKVGEIAFGPLRMRDQTAIVTNVYDTAIEGIPVDGMVGFELFRRFAVKIDYGARTITFTDPARFDTAGAGTEIPFTFYDHLPFVEGEVDEMKARFDIDTGSRSEIDLTAPFVAREGLIARYPRGVTNVTGWGVGGPSRTYVTRLGSVKLGPVETTRVVAGLSTSKAGSLSDANFEGNVGSGLLKRFVVTFDYAHQRMYLKRITPEPADAGRFDRSGLWINAEDGGYKVTSVVENGPGARAGIAVGDTIVAIDGRPAVSEELSDARTLLRAQPDGTRLKMRVRRGDQTREVEVVLRDQI